MKAETFIAIAKQSIERNGNTISEEQAIHAINLFKENIKGNLESILMFDDMERLKKLKDSL